MPTGQVALQRATSTTGIIVHKLSGASHRHSKTQSILATSSGESELYALGSAAAEALHLRAFVLEAKIASRVNTIILHR